MLGLSLGTLWGPRRFEGVFSAPDASGDRALEEVTAAKEVLGSPSLFQENAWSGRSGLLFKHCSHELHKGCGAVVFLLPLGFFRVPGLTLLLAKWSRHT